MRFIVKETVILFCLVFAIGSNALAQFHKGGEVVFCEGKVELSTDDGHSWSPVVPSMHIREGACIRTGDKASAGLIISDGSQIRLHSNSLFCLKRASSRTGNMQKRGLYELLKGNLWFRNKRHVPKPVFHMPSVVASIRGTEAVFEVEDTTKMIVLDGEIMAIGEVAGSKPKALSRRGKMIEWNGKTGRFKLVEMVKPELAAQCLLLTPQIVGPGETNKRSEAVLMAERAVNALIRWEIKRAEELAQRAIEMDSQSASAHVAMATVLQAQGRFEAALEHARRALSLDPMSIPATVRLTELLMGFDRVDEAERIVTNGLKETRHSSQAMLKMLYGYILLSKKRGEKAKKVFYDALSEQPDLAPAWLGMGLTDWFLGDRDEAILAMEKASLCAPFYAWPHNYLGKALYELKEREEAQAELRRAEQLDPMDPTPYLYLSIMLTDMHRPVEAVSALERALELNDNKLAYRSRFLLDQDRAFKNVTLAYALASLGLYSWADARGNIAVWNNPAESGAYLFRSSMAVVTSTMDTASFSDLRKFEIMAPVNANLYITYGDYQSLITGPLYQAGLQGKVGTDDTYDTTVYLNGGKGRFAGGASFAYNHTDGPAKNSGQEASQYSVKFKASLTDKLDINMGIIRGFNRSKDIQSWISTDYDPEPHIGYDASSWDFNLGYHYRPTSNSDFVGQFSYNYYDSDIENVLILPDLPKTLTEDDSIARGTRFEALWLKRYKGHRFTIGGAIHREGYYTRGKWFLPLDENHDEDIMLNKYRDNYNDWEYKFLIRDIWKFNKNLWLHIGMSCAKYDGVLDTLNFTKWMPQLAISYRIGKEIFHVGWYEEAEPLASASMLLPTRIGPFKSITGSWQGTHSDVKAFQIDSYRWDKTFVKFLFERVKRNYPLGCSDAYHDGNEWDRDKSYNLALTIDKIIGKYTAIEASFGYSRYTFDSISSSENDSDDRRRTDYSASLGITWYYPNGLKIGANLLFLNQNLKGDWAVKRDDTFWVPSVSVEKAFADNKCHVFFRAVNFTDKHFNYLLREVRELNQTIWPKRYIEAGLTLLW